MRNTLIQVAARVTYNIPKFFCAHFFRANVTQKHLADKLKAERAESGAIEEGI